MKSILNLHLSVFLKTLSVASSPLNWNTIFFIFQLRLLAITDGASHYSGVAISRYQMVYNKRFVMKGSKSNDIRHHIGRHVAYINMGEGRVETSGSRGERGASRVGPWFRFTVLRRIFFFLQRRANSASLEQGRWLCVAYAGVPFRYFITHHRIKVEAKYFGSRCRTMRCSVSNIMKIGQEIAVL